MIDSLRGFSLLPFFSKKIHAEENTIILLFVASTSMAATGPQRTSVIITGMHGIPHADVLAVLRHTFQEDVNIPSYGASKGYC